jgi:hypothetical protein
MDTERWIPSTAYVNLGSQLNLVPGFVNVDCIAWTGQEVIADLNVLPWPFEDKSVKCIRAFDIIEHLGKLTKVEILQELARITAARATILLRVPCISHPWALASIQHAHAFNYNSFEQSYAQPWFKAKVVCVQLRDGGHRFKWNRFWKFVCKWTRLVSAITFELERIEGGSLHA